MTEPIIGVIGGTGLGDAFAGESEGEILNIETPFGPPSSPITLLRWEGQKVALLLRHGPGHTLCPSAIPFRANIFALKTIGVTHIIASGATGSLREEIKPRELVIVDQVIDKTIRRDNTFFDRGAAVHVEFSHPFCNTLRGALSSCHASATTKIHNQGVYVCMEGPQFSTVAESKMHRSWGGDLVGMTCMPEAKLAREAEICYALVALATDYDCWRPHEATTDGLALLNEIMENLEAATANAVKLIKGTVAALAGKLTVDCACHDALRLAIWSDRSKIDLASLSHLKPLLGKYLAFDG